MRKVSFKEVEDIAEADKDLPEVDTLRIFRMNAKEWPFILGGGVASLVMGASMPVYAVLFGEVLGLLSEPVSYPKSKSFLLSKSHVSSNFRKFEKVLFVKFCHQLISATLKAFVRSIEFALHYQSRTSTWLIFPFCVFCV